MRIEQKKWTEAKGWPSEPPEPLRESAQLVLAFGATSILRQQSLVEHVKTMYPQAHILGCSTAGEICGTQVSDNALVTTA